MLIQVGTIAYKQENGHKKAFPLLIKETEELKQATKILFDVACEMLITDLFVYCTNASGFCAEKDACKKIKKGR